MNKLHSFTLCALAVPFLTIGAGAALAQQSTYKDSEAKQENTQRSHESNRADALATEKSADQTQKMRADGSYPTNQSNYRDTSRKMSHGYLAATPANGMNLSKLMEAEVKTSRDEDIGTVSDVLIDADGQVIAIVVGVGGILGMGEKDVAIGWDDVTRSTQKSMKSRSSDEGDLRIEATRKDLEAAPKYEKKS